MQGKWRTNSQGMIISPEAQRAEWAREGKRKKKHKTNKDKYTGRELHRYCPKCNAEITKKRTLQRNDKLGVYRDGTTVFICDKCNAVWLSKQTNKVWQNLKRNPKPQTNKEFKDSLRAF